MQITQDVHLQFADFFNEPVLAPYLYWLSKKFSEGHICIDVREMDREMLARVGYPTIPAIDKLKTNRWVGGDHANATTPFILMGNLLYFQRYFSYETMVIERIRAFLRHEKNVMVERTKALQQLKPVVKNLFHKAPSEAPDWQLIAALSAVLNDFTMITGGPGTGKTTTVAKILGLLFAINPSMVVALTAPTGKAAMRMAESLKSATQKMYDGLQVRPAVRQPQTIHRLLQPLESDIYFKYDLDHPLPVDLVIVDESSMLDVALFAKLLNAIPDGARVILLGDKAQLASVEAGSLFGDLCNQAEGVNRFGQDRSELFNEFIESSSDSKLPCDQPPADALLFEHLVELRHSYRFAADEGIGKLSRAILNNNMEAVRSFVASDPAERVHIDIHSDEEQFRKFALRYAAYLQEPNLQLAFKKLNHQRVLCAVREGPQGLAELNRKIVQILEAEGLLLPSAAFYENRPVMITRNNYELGLFNGDVGIVRKDDEGMLRVWFEDAEGGLKSVLPAFIDHAETVFAMTIHKSQGSEFDEVFVVLPDKPDLPILSRELLYTAVTRAKEKVYISASEQVIEACCARKIKRGSGLSFRL